MSQQPDNQPNDQPNDDDNKVITIHKADPDAVLRAVGIDPTEAVSFTWNSVWTNPMQTEDPAKRRPFAVLKDTLYPHQRALLNALDHGTVLAPSTTRTPSAIQGHAVKEVWVDESSAIRKTVVPFPNRKAGKSAYLGQPKPRAPLDVGPLDQPVDDIFQLTGREVLMLIGIGSLVVLAVVLMTIAALNATGLVDLSRGVGQ